MPVNTGEEPLSYYAYATPIPALAKTSIRRAQQLWETMDTDKVAQPKKPKAQDVKCPCCGRHVSKAYLKRHQQTLVCRTAKNAKKRLSAGLYFSQPSTRGNSITRLMSEILPEYYWSLQVEDLLPPGVSPSDKHGVVAAWFTQLVYEHAKQNWSAYTPNHTRQGYRFEKTERLEQLAKVALSSPSRQAALLACYKLQRAQRKIENNALSRNLVLTNHPGIGVSVSYG